MKQIATMEKRVAVVVDGIVVNLDSDSFSRKEEEIEEALHSSEIVFVVVTICDKTKIDIASVVAKTAKQAGALTITIVTKECYFEENQNVKFSKKALTRLKNCSDSIFFINSNEPTQIINTILEMMSNNENDINFDIEDAKAVLCNSRFAFISSNEKVGEYAAQEAIKSAIESIASHNVSINDAMGVLVSFHMHPNFSMMEICIAIATLQDSVHEDTEIIFGTSSDENLPADFIRATVIATGFEGKNHIAVNKI